MLATHGCNDHVHVPMSLFQNSSLVLTSENRTRDSHEPSGEPETLWGRMKGKMGDRVQYGRPEDGDDRKKKAEKKKRQQQVMHGGSRSTCMEL